MLVEFGFHAVRVMEAAELAGVPMVVHFRGSDLWLGASSSAETALPPLGANSFGGVKSEPMRRTLMGLGLNRRGSSSVLQGPMSAVSFGVTGQCRSCVSCGGSLCGQEGPLLTIRAFAQLVSEHPTPGLALWMVGDGPMLLAAKTLVEQLA